MIPHPRSLALGLTALLLTAAVPAAAQVHDLSLQILVDAPPVTPPGSSGTLTFIVTNHGPDTAGAAGTWNLMVNADIMPFSFEEGEFIDFNGISDISVCRLNSELAFPLPGEPIPLLYGWIIQEIPPGSSVTCVATFTINEHAEVLDPEGTADGVISHGWRVSTSGIGTDPDPDNNEVVVHYVLAPQPIPTLSPAGLAALAAGLLLAFSVLRRVPPTGSGPSPTGE